MSVLIYLLAIALIVLCIAAGLFLWLVKNQQFDDLDKAAAQIFFEDEPSNTPPKNDKKQQHGPS